MWISIAALDKSKSFYVLLKYFSQTSVFSQTTVNCVIYTVLTRFSSLQKHTLQVYRINEKYPRLKKVVKKIPEYSQTYSKCSDDFVH